MTYDAFKEQFGLRLNEQQDAAVQAADGPVLLLAVPGSGKTTVLVARLGYLLFCRGVPASELLTMTYTVAATQDMRSRFCSFFGAEAAAGLEFRTINGVCARIIRNYERMKGSEAFSLVSDEGTLNRLVGELLRRQNRDFVSESDIRGARTAITYAKNMRLQDAELEQLEPEGVKNFPALYRDYCDALRTRRQMDFDDQLVYAHQMLRQYPALLRQEQAGCRYLLVDEAQDTSRIQHEIIRLLAGGSRNLFLVGDEDQSIYGFRAAYPEALLRFEQDWPGAQVLLMERNYRSTRQIVAAADAFIRRNTHRHNKNMQAANGDGPEIAPIYVYDRQRQYSYVAKLAQRCTVSTAALYRDNESALPLIDLLERAGTPYRCRRLEGGFFTYRTVRDVADIVRFAQDPLDAARFLAIYYKFSCGISRAAAEQAASMSSKNGKPILENLCQLSDLSSWTLRQCTSLRTQLTCLLLDRGDRAIMRIRDDMGYGTYLEKFGLNGGKLDILQALGAMEPTPVRLLERLEELRTITCADAGNESCRFTLSTIHASKGLEYDRVLLLDVADGLLPNTLEGCESDAAPEDVAAFEEERRLFYVGMTRARRELQIFRFKNPSLTSCFTQLVFAGAPSEKKPTRQQAQAAARDFVPGTRLCHRRFGAGMLTEKQGDIVSVRFDDGSSRRFALTASLQNGQFTLPEDCVKA